MKTKKYITIAVLFLTLSSTADLFGQTRITFARGRTSATVSGTISSIGERDFILRARGGQYLSARVSSPGGCVKFSTVESYQSFTTDEGDNWLKLMNMCRYRASYSLTVSIR